MRATVEVFSSSARPLTDGTATSGLLLTTAPGTYYWTAVYSGDGFNPPSTSPCGAPDESVIITKANQTITFTSTAPASPVVGGTYNATATASSGLAVTFSSGSPSICTVSAGGAVSFVATGPCVVQANQAGNANYDPAPQVTQTVTIGKVTPAISTQASPGGLVGTPVARRGGRLRGVHPHRHRHLPALQRRRLHRPGVQLHQGAGYSLGVVHPHRRRHLPLDRHLQRRRQQQRRLGSLRRSR